MKIVQITYSGFGGLGSVVFSLIGADRAREHQWSVAFIGDQPLDESYSNRCRDQDVAFAAFLSTPGRPYRAWWRLASWLDQVRPDAIICHSINSILACRWHAWERQIPLIAVEHTPNQVKTRSERAASRVAMMVADRVVLLTEQYRQELLSAHGWMFRPAKVSVIPNGIDSSEFFPATKRPLRRGGPIRLGMAARFSLSKRQDLLVQTFVRLKEMYPELDIELVLAGDGSEIERVRQLAAGSPVGHRVHFCGLLSEQAVAHWLRDLDIYIHPTEGETLSTSLLQAMASGLPIVSSDVPGIANLLGLQGEFGVCVPNTVEAFVDVVAELIDASSRRMESGGRARARARDMYSNTVMLRSYLALMEA